MLTDRLQPVGLRKRAASVRDFPTTASIASHAPQRSSSYVFASRVGVCSLILALGVSLGMLRQAQQVAELQVSANLLAREASAAELRMAGLESAIERMSRSLILAQERISASHENPTDDQAGK
jgi:Tfp pilus assembly protein PilN